MESLHCLSPDELAILATTLSVTLFKNTKEEDLEALAGLLTAMGDILTLMSVGNIISPDTADGGSAAAIKTK
jgi:hypothetical protein